MSPYDPEEVARREAHVAAQHWAFDWQELRNGMPIPERRRQVDCHVAVDAYLWWAQDGLQTVSTVAYAWAASPRCVLVQVDDRRHPTGGAWLPPWDVWPRGGAGRPWTTTWGALLDGPPWAE